jgi:hypothetical protein
MSNRYAILLSEQVKDFTFEALVDRALKATRDEVQN